MFLVEFGCALLGAASPRLMEMAICQDYHRISLSSPTMELDCKDKEVQIKLAFMLTVVSTCSVLAGRLIRELLHRVTETDTSPSYRDADSNGCDC